MEKAPGARETLERGNAENGAAQPSEIPDWGMCALNAFPMDKRLLKNCPFENFGPVDPED